MLMEPTVNDVVFGEMKYMHRWYKNESISFFNQKYDVTVVAKAYSGKPITDQQRESYQWFNDNLNKIVEKVSNEIVDYINENCEELAVSWSGARKVNSATDLNGIVVPTTLLFKQDGTALFLFNCKWDEEHGIAVQFYPEYEIGSQDVFL